MYQRAGFSQQASRAITDEQGYDNLQALYDLETDDEVDDLVATLKQPGGQIPNPDHLVDPNQPMMIRNPGVDVPARAAKNLKLIVFMNHHYRNISRPLGTMRRETLVYLRSRVWEGGSWKTRCHCKGVIWVEICGAGVP